MSSELTGQKDIVKYQEILENHLEHVFTVFQQRFALKQKVLQALCEANNLKLINELRSNYMEEMKQILTQDRNISLQTLEMNHIKNKNEAIISFTCSKTDGDQSFEKYLRKLNDSIEEVYLIYKRQFENKTTSWLDTVKEIGQIFLEFFPHYDNSLNNRIHRG